MPMVATGIYYALALVAGSFVVSYYTRPVFSIPLLVLAAFCLWFFRDPERVAPEGPHAVSPADGKVVAVKIERGRIRLSIFLSPLDVHVNRTPIAGVITAFEYRPGKFLVASREEASEQNEQNIVTVRGDDGVELVFKQIAGLVARRVVFWKKKGDKVAMGERIGLMQFGSRMDVLFGPEWDVLVNPGERVWAATTIIARRKA
ncbi:MAG: phosphatidylserine decarboxylase family protein [Bryobacterales bacterium]|nr:phosphatidylserine decarboxylase family protein [Bryobacterales bacterium]